MEVSIEAIQKQLSSFGALNRLAKRIEDEEEQRIKDKGKAVNDKQHLSEISPVLSHQQGSQVESGYIEVPVFTGGELRPWISWMEEYFARDDFTDLQKMAMAYGFIDGEAESWYIKRISWCPFLNWEELKNELLMKFGERDDPDEIRNQANEHQFLSQKESIQHQKWTGVHGKESAHQVFDKMSLKKKNQMKNRVLENFSPEQDYSPGERLLMLRQEGTAVQYCKDFIALAVNAPELPENVLEMAFMNGLKAKTRAGVRLFEPKSLDKMMSVAKKVEEWARAMAT